MIDYKRVQIKWTDSYTFTNGWKSKDEFPEIIDNLCYSIGFIITETDKHIVVCPHVSNSTEPNEDHRFDGTMVIPKVAVLEIKEIKEATE